MPGGAHENMRGWSPEEDELLLSLIKSHGKRWKLIAEHLGHHIPHSQHRTAAMVRNRYLRIERGRMLTEQGKSKNRCGQCGQLKRGHMCPAPRALVNTSFATSEAMNEPIFVDQMAADITVVYANYRGMSLPLIPSNAPFASQTRDLDDECTRVHRYMGKHQLDDSRLFAPPLLRPQNSMELLIHASEMRQVSGAEDVSVDLPDELLRPDSAGFSLQQRDSRTASSIESI